jgi:hypothetical protein
VGWMQGVHARALDVPPAEVAPEWCTWSSVVVVVLSPHHTRTATEAVLTTALRDRSADSVHTGAPSSLSVSQTSRRAKFHGFI